MHMCVLSEGTGEPCFCLDLWSLVVFLIYISMVNSRVYSVDYSLLGPLPYLGAHCNQQRCLNIEVVSTLGLS